MQVKQAKMGYVNPVKDITALICKPAVLILSNRLKNIHYTETV